jgi:hypothetical protein
MVATPVMSLRHFFRRASVGALLLAILAGAESPHAQSPVPIADRHITYILPQWLSFMTASEAEFDAEVQQLRTRIGEAPRVRVGFTVYVSIGMPDWNVDTANATAVSTAVAATVGRLDAAIARARAHGIPFCASFATAIHGSYDAAQLDSEREDRRNMQWHADNSMAGGWWTYSRYARKQWRLQEAYMRELGRAIAARMAAFPDTFVAASGDGEVELSNERSFLVDPALTRETSLLADYSPFAVAEFRDWLRAGGLYAPGQAFAGEAYGESARYAGDASPGVDTNADGHTLNGDFGTGFSTWDLMHFDWSLADSVDGDPHAIGLAEYSAPGFTELPAGTPAGFDPPRQWQRGTPWWDTWDRFRQTMIWRFNLNLAKWITTSPDRVTGRTVPVERWYSDQIPGDYLWGATPENPNFRLDTSASPWWTADVSPYGSLGITSFNVNFGGGFYGKTLPGVAPEIGARHVRWGIFEWNPSTPATADLQVYRDEMALIEKYRPSVLAPFVWDNLADFPAYFVRDTGFEIALRELVAHIGTIPLTLSSKALNIGAVSRGASTAPQIVRVNGAPGEQPPWTIVSASGILKIDRLPDGRSFAVSLADPNLGPADYPASVVVASSDPGYTPATLTVTVRVKPFGASASPAGAFDTPADNASVSGESAVTGWALDDVGIAGVDIYRSPMPGEPTQANGLVFIGTATMVEGSRPDVATFSPSSPMSTRAGWGYMLLTNMLPSGGNGPFTLWAAARDLEGHSTILGSKRIVGANGTSKLPFGTIDTPGQGETVSGTIVNFGWALTPQPNEIPTDGSTLGVYVDGLYAGQPVYDNFRSDIAALFPGYANTQGAVGYFMLDTTRLANGVHTIAWVVRDNAGNAQGIGSRFFTVANP